MTTRNLFDFRAEFFGTRAEGAAGRPRSPQRLEAREGRGIAAAMAGLSVSR
jgi:hypothetical protein